MCHLGVTHDTVLLGGVQECHGGEQGDHGPQQRVSNQANTRVIFRGRNHHGTENHRTGNWVIDEKNLRKPTKQNVCE